MTKDVLKQQKYPFPGVGHDIGDGQKQGRISYQSELIW